MRQQEYIHEKGRMLISRSKQAAQPLDDCFGSWKKVRERKDIAKFLEKSGVLL